MQCLKIFYYRIDIFYTPSLLWFYLKLKTIFGTFARGVFPLFASSLNSCFQIKRLDQSNEQLLTISPDFFCHLGRTIFLKVVRIIGFLSLNQSGKLTLIRPSNNIKYTLQYIDYIWKKTGALPPFKVSPFKLRLYYSKLIYACGLNVVRGERTRPVSCV